MMSRRTEVLIEALWSAAQYGAPCYLGGALVSLRSHQPSAELLMRPWRLAGAGATLPHIWSQLLWRGCDRAPPPPQHHHHHSACSALCCPTQLRPFSHSCSFHNTTFKYGQSPLPFPFLLTTHPPNSPARLNSVFSVLNLDWDQSGLLLIPICCNGGDNMDNCMWAGPGAQCRWSLY